MPRPDVPRFIKGDRLEDGAGSVAYVRECRGAKGPYLKAYVSQGPRTGEWVWPDRFCRRPTIDWEPVVGHAICGDCEREFLGATDEHGSRRVWCRTCDGYHAATEKRREKDAHPSHGFGSKRPRVYRRTATDDVEDLIAQSVRGEQ